MLITAGTPDNFNVMTASWGGLGVLWGKNVCFVFVRPHRHTYKFMETNQHFTLSFFSEKYREILNFCGKNSGRDLDKISATGLTLASEDGQGVYYKEARLVLQCKKIYYHDFNPENFKDSDIDSHYPNNDYHRLYVGEIEQTLAKP